MKIQLLKGPKGFWYWRLVAKNGKVLAAAETYSSRTKAFQTVKSVWKEAREWSKAKAICENMADAVIRG